MRSFRASAISFSLCDGLSQDGGGLACNFLGRPAQAKLIEPAAEGLAELGFYYVQTTTG
ncbi:MAG TPA: hypothetical protein VN969_00845 [Streptosporangiaceae bacterium]|nr:hypothetical protein [Streptosporangiaceae bacterium]